MAKQLTNARHSPSRAVGPARGRAKRRQGCMRAGLWSNEMTVVRSAEVVTKAEGKTAQTDRVRSGRAPRCRRTQARMYVQRRDLGGLPVTTVRSTVVAKVKAVAKRRMHGGEESDSGILCAGQRPDQVGSSPTGAQVRSAISESGGNASLAGVC